MLSWDLPDGAVQTGYKIRIYRTRDLNAAGQPFYRPVGGTRDGTVRYSERGEGADWVFEPHRPLVHRQRHPTLVPSSVGRATHCLV